MQAAFKKIIEKLEVEADSANDKIMEQETEKDMAYYDGYDDGCSKAIEIVKQEAEKYEECYKDCGDCEAYNKEKHHCPKFCKVIKETVKEIEENHNGWIPVEEELPETDKYILLSFSNFSIPCVGRYEEDENGGAFYVGDDDETCVSQDMFVNAWMNLPDPYQTKGE